MEKGKDRLVSVICCWKSVIMDACKCDKCKGKNGSCEDYIPMHESLSLAGEIFDKPLKEALLSEG